jgi:CRP/FNR family cyclic AMP-dependent transcriptional regulator
MRFIDILGYAASCLVVVTFYMKDIVPLRAAALCSNVLFLSYGISLNLGPVALLHATLIPINVWRLSQALLPGQTTVGIAIARRWHNFARRFTTSLAEG